MKMLLKIVALLTATFSAPLGAQSVEEICGGNVEAFQEPPFETFDTDSDQHIDRRESENCSSLQRLFEELDVDDDGTLTPIEYEAFAEIWAERVRSFGPGR